MTQYTSDMPQDYPRVISMRDRAINASTGINTTDGTVGLTERQLTHNAH